MKKFRIILTVAIALGSLQVFATDLTPGATATSTKNYLHTLLPQTINGSSGAMIENIQYFDGLGRPLQTIQWQGSPSQYDIVTPFAYDVFGREDKKYLPYRGSNTNGSFVSTALTGQSSYYTSIYGETDGLKAYSQADLELSPLNRILRQGAPGATWQPGSTASTDHSVKFDYGFNGSSEVRLWSVTNDVLTDGGYYSAKTLFKTTTWDENSDKTSSSSSKTVEYKDKLGNVVLKRAYSDTIVHSTYYVYDEFQQLRYVFPPKATSDGSITSTELSELCYQYKYDGLKRMIVKKLPGADSISMVYDNRDRLVMSQDGNARAAGKWMFTKYDYLNRPVMTGYLSTSQTAAQLRTAFKDYTGTAFSETAQSSGDIGYSLNDSYLGGNSIGTTNILSVTYYDNYGFLGVNGFSSVTYNSSYDIDTYSGNYFTSVKGHPVGSKIKALDGNEFTTSAVWLYSASYYDDRYRVIQARRTLFDNSSGGVETLASKYDFTGKLDQTKLVQTFNGATTTVDKYFTYDSQGRLTKIEQEIAGDSNGRVTVAENVYNETGQLATKKLHKVGASYLQNVDYGYNIRGWLTSINNPDNLSSDLFGERLLYESSESGLNSSYPLQYNGNISAMVWNSDQKSRQGYGFSYDGLNRLTTGDYKYYSGGWNDHSKYEERSLTYDKNGNIGTMLRSDQNGNTADNFSYSYSGNKLSNINGGTSYVYDQNGNTTTDGLRGMTIGYNVLNLPSSITKSSESISYIYSVLGEKLAKRMKDNSYNYYAGNMVYNSDKSLKYILFEEGLVNKSSGAFTYEYHLKDHLGNTRIAFQPNGGGTTTTQVAEYYPFGSTYAPLSPAGTNKYLYNGKEKQEDVLSGTALDEYDYGARFYDARIGRWNSVDPLAETYNSWSPYHYAMNNPIRFTDVFGMGAGDFYDEDGKFLGTDGIEDDKAYIVTDKNEKKEIKATDKKGGTTQAGNVSSAVETTKTELGESLNVLDRTVSNGGNREEASVVTESGKVLRGDTGSAESQTLSDGTVVKTTELPANEGNNNTSIHSHPTAANVTSDGKIESNSATVPGPKDPGVFKGYKRNIIVGNLGYSSGQKQLDGSVTVSKPSQGSVIYDRNSKPLVQLTRNALKRITK